MEHVGGLSAGRLMYYGALCHGSAKQLAKTNFKRTAERRNKHGGMAA